MHADLRGRRVLVTGGTGFVGHHVATQLVHAGAIVRALVRPASDCSRLERAGVVCCEGDLLDRDSLSRACESCEYIFHLAGAVHFGPEWARTRQVNLEGTRRVLEAARTAAVRRVVHTSSIVAVGACTRPIVLDEHAQWDLEQFRIPYVTTKREAEQLALEAAGNRLDVIVVNPASVVGPDDFSRSEFGTLCRRFWRGRIPCYFGGGNCFVDVRDVARGHLLAALHGRTGQRYILGGENLSYGQFFQALARAADRCIFRVRLPNWLRSSVATLSEWLMADSTPRPYLSRAQSRLLPRYFYFDSGKARRELGYRSRPLTDSLADAHRFWFGTKAA